MVFGCNPAGLVLVRVGSSLFVMFRVSPPLPLLAFYPLLSYSLPLPGGYGRREGVSSRREAVASQPAVGPPRLEHGGRGHDELWINRVRHVHLVSVRTCHFDIGVVYSPSQWDGVALSHGAWVIGYEKM